MRSLLYHIFMFLLLTKCCQAQEMPYVAGDPGLEDIEMVVQHSVFNWIDPLNQAGIQSESTFINKALSRGEELARMGKCDEAIQLYQNMLLYTPLSSPYRENIYRQLSNAYNYTGRYREALDVYYQALKLTSDIRVRAKMFVNISSVYTDLKDYDKAMQILDQVIGLLEKENDRYWAALAHNSKGSVYNARDRYTEAIAEFYEAYRLAASIVQDPGTELGRKKQMTDFASLLLNNIADTYLKQGMTDSALHYLQLIPAGFEGSSEYTRCCILITLGQVYSMKGADKTALEYLEQALVIGEPSRYQLLNRQVYETMAVVHARMGHYQEAWKNQKRFAGINDSLLSIESIQKINNLERQYDLSRKDQELVRKELLISRQAGRLKEHNWLAGILVLAVVSIGCIFLVSRKSYRNRQKLLKEQLSSNLKDRKIMQIEAGIKGEEKERTRIARDLHDGVVSEMLAMKLNLQALGAGSQELKRSDDYRNILFQAEEVTEKLRRAAHNLMPANLQEHGLVHTIEAFLNRINNHNVRFTFQHFGAIPELNEMAGKIILMMTMELIQNILKHAKATEAIIQLGFFEDNMSITAEDNGVGIGNNFIGKKGIGLANIESNVALLNGSLDIRSSEYTGTTVLIEIPWNEHTVQGGSIV